MKALLQQLEAKRATLQSAYALVQANMTKFANLDNELKDLKLKGTKITLEHPKVKELIELGQSIGYTANTHTNKLFVIQGQLSLLEDIITLIKNR